MKVNVVFSGLLHDVMRTLKLGVELDEGSTVKDLINKVIGINKSIRQLILSDDGKLRENVLVLVNGRDIVWLNGINTVLHDNDMVLMALKIFLA